MNDICVSKISNPPLRSTTRAAHRCEIDINESVIVEAMPILRILGLIGKSNIRTKRTFSALDDPDPYPPLESG